MPLHNSIILTFFIPYTYLYIHFLVILLSLSLSVSILQGEKQQWNFLLQDFLTLYYSNIFVSILFHFHKFKENCEDWEESWNFVGSWTKNDPVKRKLKNCLRRVSHLFKCIFVCIILHRILVGTIFHSILFKLTRHGIFCKNPGIIMKLYFRQSIIN